MKAKHYFFAAVALLGIAASTTILAQTAQPTTFPATVRNSGVTVAPWPFKQTDSITITVNTTQTFPKGVAASMNGATAVWIHGGVNLGPYGTTDRRWQKVDQTGEWLNKPTKCQFVARTGVANTFDLRLRPSNFWALAADENISEICCVFNDGQSNNTKEGGAAPTPDKPTDPKSDFFIPLGAVASSVQNSDIFTATNSYPNPATDVVNINFGLKSTGNVTLKIFNAQGVEVATLLDGNTMSGNALHIMQWDVTNAAGKKVPSGVYFFRLMVNGATETGKIMVN